MCNGCDFVGFLLRKVSVGIELPQPQPMLEMLWLQAKSQMRRSESPAIPGWPSCLKRPELSDLVQMCRPILDLSVENRPKHGVLPGIDVEWLDQLSNTVMATKAAV